ncbi:Condensin-2 complex subunit G2 [Rhynchospora pubera]|uniref:Condensin-2 complex subunit G2 n=1 Tax=Rhynchospora pubera TaxID=906938 RepID=A0AAV8EJ83_9POAL|nr:Condensin-2 complex subunit G2 [Rhynchospora pubera]
MKKKSSKRRSATTSSSSGAAASVPSATTFATTDELLSAALSLPSSSLKTLIHSIPFTSDLFPSLPTSLHSRLVASISSLQDPSASPPHSPPPASPSVSPPSKRSRLDHLSLLKTYASIAYFCFSHPEKPFAPDELLPCVQCLHDSLVLFESEETLILQVASLCEDWWKEKLPGRELLISQSLPYFLSRSVTAGRRAEVRRVFALREAFALFDYEDESIEDFKLLLLRCFICPVYVKSDEGRKILAFVLGLNEKLAKDALSLIRSQIPIGKKSVLVAYGEILFRVWKGIEKESIMKEEIEDRFLLGLIEGAILARSKGLNANIRRILGAFVEQRTTSGVEKLLCRLVEPVLFRSLQAANSEVRLNTLHLFLDIFPILDPDSTREENDNLLEKQLYFLEKLLSDDAPEIRAVSVEGLCKILRLFWEVIPTSNIPKFLTKVIDEMSFDVCNEVRVSVLNGVRYLIENPLSHEIMRVLLSRIGRVVTDSALSVRAAAIDLLLAVCDNRFLQYNKIVDLETLVSLLGGDHTRVAQKITKLLLPTYFPTKLPLKDACVRCISLIKRSPPAGVRFCEFSLLEGSSANSLAELVRVSLLLAFSPNKGLDQDQTDGLVIAIDKIINSLSGDGEDSSALNPVRKLITVEKIKVLIDAVSSDQAREAVLNIASSLLSSTGSSNGLRDVCMEIILSEVGLSENLEKQRLVVAARKLIFSCGLSELMLEGLASALGSSVRAFSDKSGEDPASPVSSTPKVKKKHAKKAKSSKPVISSTSELAANAAAASWQVKDLLMNEETKEALLNSLFSDKIYSYLKALAEVFIEKCFEFENLDVSPVLAYLTYAKYASLQEDNNRSSPDQPTTVDNMLEHILNCIGQLLEKLVSDEPSTLKRGRSTEMNEGSEVNSTHNIVKISTAILKFVLDNTTTGLVKPEKLLRCLEFASTYTKYMNLAIKSADQSNSTFDLDTSKETLVLLRSSFTYMAKLLHLVITTLDDSSEDAFHITNSLLDLVPCVETHLGARHASLLIPVAKQWLPVFILGLGSKKLIPSVNETSPKLVNIPLWLSTLSKFSEESENEENISFFEKLIENLVILLKKGSPKILDAVGSVLLAGIEMGLEKGHYVLVEGLSRFVCSKLLGSGYGALDNLELLRGYMQELLIAIENCLGDGECEEGREQLENAMGSIRTVLLSA